MVEKMLAHVSKNKVLYAIFIPLLIFAVVILFTKDFDRTTKIILDILSIVGFIVTIFVLENTEKSKQVVDNLLNEIWNQEITIIENDLKEAGKFICLSNIPFDKVEDVDPVFAEKMLRFNLSLKKYTNYYESLKSYSEVQNFYRYMKHSNTISVLKSKQVYDSYIKIVEPLYVLIDSEISKNSKERLKKMEE